MTGDKLTAGDIKSIVIPIIINVIVGIGAGYISIITLSTQQVYNDRQFADIKEALQIVNKNQIELASRGVWMQTIDARLTKVERAVDDVREEHREDIKELKK